MLRYGLPIRTAVSAEVAAALLEHGKRIARSTGHVAALALESWYELETNTPPAVRAALESEAARCGMSVPALVRTLVGFWYEDVWEPTHKLEAKKNPA